MFEKYHPIEKDPNISDEDKFKAMERWWKEHYELLKEKGLELQHIKKAVEHPNIQFKEGVKELFEIVLQKRIPLIIFSSSWLGDVSIKMTIERFKLPFDDSVIKIISNKLLFDENWKFVGVEKIIHAMNKRLVDILKWNEEIQKLIEWKDSYFLMGDSLNDIKMA